MRRSPLFLGALAALFISQAASAQEVTAGVALQTGSPDDNGFDYTMAPTAIGDIKIEFGDNVAMGVTGYKNLEGAKGDELDATLDVTPLRGVTLTAEYYSLRTEPDIVHLGVTVEQDTGIGTFDLSMGQYLTAGPDATRFQIGLSPKLGSESFDLRVYGTHERGYDLEPITTAGVEAEWHLNDRWSITGNAIIPLNHLDQDDPRGQVFTIGLRATF